MAYQPAPGNFQGQPQVQAHPNPGQDAFPPPPPLSSMHVVQGYENVKFSAGKYIIDCGFLLQA